MDVQVLSWVAISVLVAAVAVYGLMIAGRRALESRVNAAQSALAVAESRVAALSNQNAELAQTVGRLEEDCRKLTGEREGLRTSLAKTGEDLARELATVAKLQESVQQGTDRITQLDSDYRVAKSQCESLGRRVAELEEANRQALEEVRQQNAALAHLRAGVAGLEKERDGLNARLTEQKAWIEEQTAAMESRIKVATDQLLEEKSIRFSEVNKRELGTVVEPFKEKLTEFRQRVDEIHTKETEARGELKQQIVQLTDLNQLVSQRAEDLTTALTTASKSTGDWGETILSRILETSGLREGKEYRLQYAVTGAEGERRLLDAVVFLPEDRQVIVDSKVSNKAWTEYCAAKDDEEREERLAAHLASLRAHIKGLSAKDYARAKELHTVDFVLMFVPVEGALLAAFANDDSLYSDAYKSKIILVTPSTLMAVLKLIEGMWLYQRRKESADKIAEAGKKLYEKLATFSNTFLEVGDAIERAHDSFEKAKGQLSTGKGNAVRLAQKMVELGVGPGKALPKELLDLSDENDADGEEPAALPPPGDGTTAE